MNAHVWTYGRCGCGASQFFGPIPDECPGAPVEPTSRPKSNPSEIPAMEPVRAPAPQPLARGEREPLPGRRASWNARATIPGLRVHMTAGEYIDGRLGEIFVDLGLPQGTAMRGLMNTLAIITSVALQYGTPLKALVESVVGIRFEPSGEIAEEDAVVTSCLSLVDYVFRELGVAYLGREDLRVASAPTLPPTGV